MKKIAQKKFKPAFTVDLTNVNNVEDAYVKFALAKQEAGVPMNCNEFNSVIDKVINLTIDAIFSKRIEELGWATVMEVPEGYTAVITDNGIKVKKHNIFKRFWNWLRRK